MRLIKADKVFDGQKFIDPGMVLVLDAHNAFVDCIPESHADAATIETYSGLVCPGFVNAHCHLELSHFLGAINRHRGLAQFAQHLVRLRPTFNKQVALEQMHEWDQHMHRQGIVAVGDICNTPDSFAIKQQSKIHYHSFVELIGLNPANAAPIFAQGLALLEQLKALGLQGSLVPHAPYSTSTQLIQLIAEHNHALGATTSIHLDESLDEQAFLHGKPGGFDALYQFLKINLSWYKSPKTQGISLLAPLLSQSRWLLVHNTFGETAKLEANQQVFRCYCPNANLYIEDQLPDFAAQASDGIPFCLGTDSLASNHHLDMVSEMNLLKKYSPFSDEDILRAATATGAEALGIQASFGRLIPGRNTGLNHLHLHNDAFHFIKKIS